MLAGGAPGVGAGHGIYGGLSGLCLHLRLHRGAAAVPQLRRFLNGLLQSDGQRADLGLALAVVEARVALGAAAGLAKQSPPGRGPVPAAARGGFAGPAVAFLCGLTGLAGTAAGGRGNWSD